MATTDTRSGFRLPWSSDRSQADAAREAAVESTQDPEAGAGSEELAIPDAGLHGRLGIQRDDQAMAQSPSPDTASREEPQRMVELNTAPPSAPAAPRKPSKLMADLSAAIRATAEAARDQALAQVDADAKQVVETIREQSTGGSAALRQQSEEDIAGIREWSKAEIARIREETDQKISSRKATLDWELSDHAASVDHRIDQVQAEVARYQAEMEAYLDRLRMQDDPASLATMAESLPDAPSFAAWTGVADTVEDEAEDAAPAPEVAAQALPDEPPVTSAVAEARAPVEAEAPPADAGPDEVKPPHAVASENVEVAAEPDTTAEVVASADQPPFASTGAGISWGEDAGGWSRSTQGTMTIAPDPAGDADHGWASGETAEGFRVVDEAGEPVDRGAVLDALEAAAQAAVADEPATDVEDPGAQEAAQAALEARVDAGGYEGKSLAESESFADRLASLLPGHGGDTADSEPATTQVVVSGLVSVASIASFKRHLGRLSGVQGVAVASGPEGEFVFNVTHRPDVLFRDVIPTLPGFGARVTGAGDGVVQVTARDPEAES